MLDLRGRQVGIVDVLVEELGFAWEIDSVQHHFATPEQVATPCGGSGRCGASDCTW